MLKIKTLIKKQKLEFSYVWGKIRNEETSASLKSQETAQNYIKDETQLSKGEPG